MFVILDALYIKTVEKQFGFKFSASQIEEARSNEGHVGVRIEGKYQHFRIPIVHLKDLLPSYHDVEVEVPSPW